MSAVADLSAAPTETDRTGFLGYSWRESTRNEPAFSALKATGINEILADLAARRIGEGENPLHWIDPRISTMQPDPFSLKDMPKAAEIIADEIENAPETGAKRCVGLFGDYDVDGAASTALLARYLEDLGLVAHVRIPDRISEGYGPNIAGLRELREKGCDLIVILDTGALAFEVLETAAAEGMRIVVVDHHMCEERLPNALAVVNPNRLDDTSGFGHMCAGGLALFVAIAVHSTLKKRGYFASRKAPDLKAYLDLAALATVADVAPLKGINRAIVSTGMRVMDRRENEGLAALLHVAGTQSPIRAHHLGFHLGPRINAGGRISDAWKGSLLLRSRDVDVCSRLARDLDEINVERKRIEDHCREDAFTQVSDRLGSSTMPRLAWAVGDYHEGVIGIAAGRIKERFLRPAVVFAAIEGGQAKGSARSIEGFDLGAAVIAAVKEGLLVKGGGHPMAAGMTVELDKIEAFADFIDGKIAESDFARIGAPLKWDVELDASDISADLVQSFGALEPFGQGNPSPRFLLRGWKIESMDLLKDLHVRIRFRSPNGSYWKAMLFNAAGGRLATGLEGALNQGASVDLVSKLKLNEWNGRVSVELDLEDARGC